jgi:hypothetical protein
MGEMLKFMHVSINVECVYGRRDSVVGIVARLWTWRSGVPFSTKQEGFLFSRSPDRLGPTQWVMGFYRSVKVCQVPKFSLSDVRSLLLLSTFVACIGTPLYLRLHYNIY